MGNMHFTKQNEHPKEMKRKAKKNNKNYDKRINSSKTI